MNADDTNEAQRYHVGSTIAGRYRVERPIGEGAMGAVALARHVSLDETVAIKFLRPELRRDPAAIGRLSREAKALARIKSDHVARVLDVGATLSVGPYMVMEYLEGTDLGALLDEEGPLPVARAVECVLQLCEALTVAHTAGIVHRDIKPQNLFLARHGQFETLKVLDFGICDGAAASLPGADGMPYGTPSYMSPERVRNDPSADHRADIWSIGVVLHELVTGHAVFDGGELTDICARIISDAPIALEPDVRVLPAELRAIIGRCLERDPSRRYQSVEELAAALAPLGTMHERFRGRTTGAFSRSLLQQELANARSLAPVASATQPPAPAAVARTSPGAGSAPPALGAGARGSSWGRLAQRVPLRALALALAGLVVIGSLVRGMAWMAPPPVSSSHAAPAATSAAATSAAATSAAATSRAVTAGAGSERPSAERTSFAATWAPPASPPAPPPAEPSPLAAEAPGQDPAAAPAPTSRAERRAVARARARARSARAKNGRARAAASADARARDKAAETSAAEAPPAADGRSHVSRVRLVDDRRARRSPARAATARPASSGSP